MVSIKGDERNKFLRKLGIADKQVVRAMWLGAGKSHLERALQHMYSSQLQFDRKDNPVSVKERSYETDITSRSKRTTAVIADIAIKDQVTDKSDTLQVE